MNINDFKLYSSSTYVRSLSSEELQAVQKYSKESAEINNALRSDDGSELYYREQIDLIDSALDKFKLDMPLKMYRKLFFLTKGRKKAILTSWAKKGYIHDLAYMSTSLDKYSYDAPFNVMLEITSNHTKGAFIEPLAVYNENEFLIKRNSILRIESIETKYVKRLSKNIDVVKVYLD